MTREEAIDHLFDIETDAVYDITIEEKESIDMAIEALKLIPDNATNIDVIRSLFPNGSQVKGAGIYMMDDKRSNLNYDIDWGEAPHRKE